MKIAVHVVRNGWPLVLALCVGRAEAQASRIAPPELHASEDMRIDGAGQDLSAVGIVGVSSRGVIAVTQPQDHVIRFFKPDGTPLGRFGGDGEGPGEFRTWKGPIGWLGDTLWVEDLSLRRITFITPDDKLAGTKRVDFDALTDVHNRWYFDDIEYAGLEGIQTDHKLVVGVALRSTMQHPEWLHDHIAEYVVVRTDPVGHILRAIAIEPDEGTSHCQEAAGPNVLLIPFCARTDIQASRDGQWVVSAMPTSAGRYRVTEEDGASGDTLFDRTMVYHLTAIPPHVRDSVRARLVLHSGPQLAGYYRKMEFPATYAPFNEMLIGRDGSVWLGHPVTTDTLRDWSVISPRGALVGVVKFPRGARLFVADVHTAWATVPDESGLESVVRWKIH